MAVSTYNTTLLSGESAETLTVLADIKDYPDLGGAPEQLETTTLVDKAKVYIEGLESNDSKEFTFNYTKATYDALLALKGLEKYYGIYFGEDGIDGKFVGKGTASVYIVGAGANAVREMKLTITLSEPFEEVTA